MYPKLKKYQNAARTIQVWARRTMDGLKSGRRALSLEKLENTAFSDLMGRRVRKIINYHLVRHIQSKLEQSYNHLREKWKM